MLCFECLAADLTGERRAAARLRRVRRQVSGQHLQAGEGFAARVAAARLLTFVDQLVL